MEYTQQRVVQALERYGRIPAKEICSALPGLDRCGLDAALSALMRQRRVSLALGFYELLPEHRKPAAAARPNAEAPPTAEEEASASVDIPKEQQCGGRCGHVKPAEAFSRGASGRLFKNCKLCVEVARSDGQLARQQRAAPRPVPIDDLTKPAVVTAEPPPRYLPNPNTAEALMSAQPDLAPDPTATVPIIDQVHAAAIQELKTIEEETTRLAQRKGELATFLRVYDRLLKGARA